MCSVLFASWDAHPVLRATAALVGGLGVLEVGWRGDVRQSVAWGIGGLSYRLGITSGTLQWRGSLDARESGWASYVVIPAYRRGEADTGTGGPVQAPPGQERHTGRAGARHAVSPTAAKRKEVMIGSSNSSTPRWLRWWTNTDDELIAAIGRVRVASSELDYPDGPEPLLPRARRSLALWGTWAVVTAAITVPFDVLAG
jgi:hypothetical protein